MGLQYSIWDERNFYTYEDELEEKYYHILNSNLSILRIWLSLFGKEKNIKVRANNIYYSDCFLHKASDIPVCINNNNKGFHCYGCGRGGTIITLIHEYFNISSEDTLNILYAYIVNDFTSLSNDDLEIIKRIFNNYNSPVIDKYLEKSKEKTEFLNDRIDKYIEKFGDSPSTVKKMTKRLCCSRNYIMKNK